MSGKRQQIIETAHDLFGKNGFYATGVDQIMAQAGISKRTMYKYFESKTDLILAVVEHYRDTVRAVWNEVLESKLTSREKILEIFNRVLITLSTPGFHGCIVVNVMSEFTGKEKRIESACQSFKRWELETLEKLVADTGGSDHAQKALKLFLIIEGMFAYTQVKKSAPPDSVLQWVEEIIPKPH